MRISVIVPLYNKAAYIERCLKSISAQTHRDFEAIVVDDGSTDGSAAIAAAFRDSRFRLIRQANAGPGAARNRGLAEAACDLVGFLDADDEWRPEFLDQALHAIEQAGPSAVAASFGYMEYPGGQDTERLWRRRGLREGAQRITPASDPALLAVTVPFMTPCNTLCRTNGIRALGGFYDRQKCVYGEDSFLWLKLLLNHAVVLSLRPLVCVHREASGLSTNLGHARPVEPFLLVPEEIEPFCAPELRPVLARFLAIRAFKTACMLGYWGHWSEARLLRRRFQLPGSWRLPYFMPSLVCGTPVGPALGSAWRGLFHARTS